MIFKEMQNLCGQLLTEVLTGWFLACKSAERGSSRSRERRRVFTNFNHENARSSYQDESGRQKAGRTKAKRCAVCILILFGCTPTRTEYAMCRASARTSSASSRLLTLFRTPSCPRLRRIHQELLPTPCFHLLCCVQRKEIVGRWLGRGGWEQHERGGLGPFRCFSAERLRTGQVTVRERGRGKVGLLL